MILEASHIPPSPCSNNADFEERKIKKQNFIFKKQPYTEQHSLYISLILLVHNQLKAAKLAASRCSRCTMVLFAARKIRHTGICETDQQKRIVFF